MRYNIRYNPNWLQNKGARCYFCGETRSVKYFAEMINEDGKWVMIMDACNRCAAFWLTRKEVPKNDRT